MSETAIRLVNAGKRYVRYEDEALLIKAVLRLRPRTARSHLWAVRGVNLEIQPGECVGIIGRNGAGKSTLLQMIAGVTAPTEGSVAVRGRVAPLVSVGVGFHPELTGRENVYVNGTILGMTRDEIDERFESILDFSEIGRFIDTPVKFYSSGMYVRLGFAVAVQAEPQILLVDEVLAVGDIAYQVKCFDRMMAIRERGTTVVLVSHNLGAVQRLCDRTVLVNAGEVAFDGNTADAISVYHTLLETHRDPDFDSRKDSQPHQPGMAAFESFRLIGPSGEPTGHVNAGDRLLFRLRVRCLQDLQDPVFNIIISDELNQLVYKEPSYYHPSGHYRAGSVIECDIEFPAALSTGSFVARTTLQTSNLSHYFDRGDPLMFYIAGRPMVGGVADLHAKFQVRQLDGDAATPAAEVEVAPAVAATGGADLG